MDTRVCRDASGHSYPVYASDSESESVIPLSFTLISPPKGHGNVVVVKTMAIPANEVQMEL